MRVRVPLLRLLTSAAQRLAERPPGLRQCEASAARFLRANLITVHESNPGKKQIAQDSVVAAIIFGLEAFHQV